ncbi:MAG: sodium:proton antiporter, partial [Actinobacteria bacterium]|nr:sodium:proton antiporter [Actinomycetota bacterium]
MSLSTQRTRRDLRSRDRNETPEERADRNWSELLQEFRVTQTGTQLIAGFLLTLPFQQRFSVLSTDELATYMALVFLAALATGIGLAVVALHRGLFHRHRKPLLVSTGDRLLRVNVALTALLTSGIVLLIAEVVLRSRVVGWVCGGSVFLVLAVLL